MTPDPGAPPADPAAAAGGQPKPPSPADTAAPGTTTYLIRKGQAGDASALGELFCHLQEFARRAAARPYLSPTDQENVASDALGSVMLRLGRFENMQGGENLRALLRLVIQRKIANLIRERNRKAGNFGRGGEAESGGPDRTIEEMPDRVADPAEQVLINDAIEGVLIEFVAALRAKPEGDYHAGVFADMCRGRTVEEMAAARDCSTRTVKRHRTLVTKLLSEFLTENGFEITEDTIRSVLKLSAD